MIPKRHDFFISYMLKSFENSQKSLPPSTLLKGEEGVGKSWVLSELYKKSKKVLEPQGIIPVKIQYRLSAYGVVNNIQKKLLELELEEISKLSKNKALNRPVKFILFWDGFDKLYELPKSEAATRIPKRAFGVGSTIVHKIQMASELRSFLIENSHRISVIGTVKSVDFMTKEELPFFNFFNLLKIDCLTSQESAEYISGSIKHSKMAQQTYKIITLVNSYQGIDVCDGKISYLNLFADTLLEDYQKCKTNEDVTTQFFNSFFIKLNPFIENSLSSLSELEKTFLDSTITSARLIPRKQLPDLEGNTPRIIKNLIDKEILDKKTNLKSNIKIKSTALWAWFIHKR